MLRPIECLPVPHPLSYDPSVNDVDFFYKSIGKHLIKDTIRIMDNGLPIDLAKVGELEVVVDTVLDEVSDVLSNNAVMQAYLATVLVQDKRDFKEDRFSLKRDTSYYIKKFKHGDMVHRSYFMELFVKANNITYTPKDELDLGIPKWLASDVKALSDKHIKLRGLIAKESVDIQMEHKAMRNLAQRKAFIHNKVYDDVVSEDCKRVNLPKFNPASDKQLVGLFQYLGVTPISYTDGGTASWKRDNIEEINYSTKDDDIKAITSALIEFSFSAIIKNNFIKNFYKYTIDDVLYGNYKLFGAKTGRYTSNSPNLLNMPSTKSKYAGPLKECFVAPEGFVVWGIDYAALEDRVIANLSGDENKLNVFKEDLDGHSLACTYYYPKEVEKFIGKFTDNKEAAKLFKKATKTDKEAKSLRQDSKSSTFKLAYGGYPDSVITQEIFDNYHDNMFPGITEFRDLVERYAKSKGYNHLGLGFRLYSDDVRSDIRTLFNGSSQFWSILSTIAINELHHQIDVQGKEDEIFVTSTIYDSIYGIIPADAESIKWLNDTLVPIMIKDFLEDQEVHNEANLEIGSNWSNLVELSNDATVQDIREVLEAI